MNSQNINSSLKPSQSQPNSSTQNNKQSISIKLEKVKLFMSSSDQQLPVITSTCTAEQLGTQMRKYFNDQQILFFKDPLKRNNCFKNQQFEKELQNILHSYIIKQQAKFQLNTNKKSQSLNKQWKIDFIDFVQTWINSIPQLNVFYSDYNRLIQNQIQNYSNDLSRQISKNTSFVQEDQTKTKTKASLDKTISKNLQFLPNQSKGNDKLANNQFKQLIQIQKKQNQKVQQQNSPKQSYEDQQFQQENQHIKETIYYQDDEKNLVIQYKNQFIQSRAVRCQVNPFEHYLKQFYNFYCKKIVNSMKNQSFEVLQKYYSTMSLTKFMMYCKDLKISQSLKCINIKYLQKLFKKHQNMDHSLTFEKFQEAVKQILQKAYSSQDQIKTQGYQLIGVLNKQNNQKVMKSIGIIVPMNKIVFKRAEQARSLSKVVQSKIKDEMKKSKIVEQNNNFPSLGLKNGGYAYAYQNQQNKDKKELKNPIFMSQNDRKQQKLLQNITIPKLNKLKPSKEVDLKLNELIDDQYDPYLKRYNQKNSSYNDKHHMYQGVMKRIDQRIQNVVRKVR